VDAQIRVLAAQLEHVVVVHEAEVDLAALDGLDHRDVARVRLGVVRREPLEEPGRGVVAELDTQRADPVLERRVRRCDPHTAGVRGVRQVQHRRRQRVFGIPFGRVHEHTGAARHPDPLPVRSAERRIDLIEHPVGERREPVLPVEEAERPGRLRQEHVGGRVVALGVDLQRDLGRSVVEHLDVDARLVGEPLEQGPDELLVATAVDRERRPVVAAAGPECEHDAGGGCERGRGLGETGGGGRRERGGGVHGGDDTHASGDM
jgi:hypothetical protein